MDFKKIKLRLNQTPFRNVIRVGSHLERDLLIFAIACPSRRRQQ
jgi:hypothetical protein